MVVGGAVVHPSGAGFLGTQFSAQIGQLRSTFQPIISGTSQGSQIFWHGFVGEAVVVSSGGEAVVVGGGGSGS